MTRETKIGLLVGLAFIIVIGILLSDHMTSTTQPQQASLAEVAPNVRESMTTPAPANPGPAPVVTVPPINPPSQILAQSELRPPVPPAPASTAPPVSQVVIGGPAGQPAPPIAIRQSAPPVIVQADQQAAAVDAQPTDAATAALERWANQPGGATAQPPVNVVAATPAKREYVAQPGDSLSRIAAKFFGTGTKANMDAIIKANPSLQKNPDLVVVGRKYTIPQEAASEPQRSPQQTESVASGLQAIPDTVPVTPRGTASRAIPVTELVDPLPARTAAPDGAGDWYVVKDNDNLWKIAAEQLGSGNAWLQIKELNKDILKGGETVQPNMRLRLPAKPLASAN